MGDVVAIKTSLQDEAVERVGLINEREDGNWSRATAIYSDIRGARDEQITIAEVAWTDIRGEFDSWKWRSKWDIADEGMCCITLAEALGSTLSDLDAKLNECGLVSEYTCGDAWSIRVMRDTGRRVAFTTHTAHPCAAIVADLWPGDDRRPQSDCGCVLCRIKAASDRRTGDTGWVYFVRSGDSGPVKIGTSVNVSDRVATLQTGNDKPLKLLAHARGGARFERLLHRQFDKDRVRGEWFTATDDLLKLIEELQGR